jgi:tripeptide aminopeptidase
MTNKKRLLDAFCRYVKIDTQSEDGSETYPSTEKQKDLLRILVEELKGIGLSDAVMDEFGYVMATLPSNIPSDHAAFGKVPTIGLLAHVDTYHEVSGKDVRPQIHENYDGGDITLPGDSSIVIKASEEKELAGCKGMTIITSDGTTLLGGDDKAGIAEIMEALTIYKENPDRLHGDIRIGFTPDEEIGCGTDHFDVKKFNAKCAYTIDGSGVGELEDETFCADTAIVTITGADVHPGYAKDKMINSVRVASDLIMQLPQNRTPETTEKKEGYLHPMGFAGNVSETKITFLVRDFTEDGLAKLEELLEKTVNTVKSKYSGSKIDIEIKKSYKNMKVVLDEEPNIVNYADEAIRRTGIETKKASIRGGTDGARLSFMGLPTPNIFDGSMNFHSKKEWIPLEWMEKATETILNLMDVWVEKSA